MRTIIGIIFLLLPFIGLFTFGVIKIGLYPIIMSLSLTALIVACIAIGVNLILS
jgi:hypothetical protein